MAWQKIDLIEEINYDGDVYNLHVEDNHNYFANGINVSNCHTFKSTSLTGIMDKMTNTKYRIGTTGTIDNSKVNKLVLEGTFGSLYKVISTKELMDAGSVANLKIKCLIMKYDETTRKIQKNNKYPDEMDFLVGHEKRNRFIRNLAVSCEGNTLVLFQYVEKHGAVLHELIANKVGPDRKVFFIHGGTKAIARESARLMTESESNAIIIKFGDITCKVQNDAQIPLVNGSFKIARNITTNDDVSDDWIQKYSNV